MVGERKDIKNCMNAEPRSTTDPTSGQLRQPDRRARARGRNEGDGSQIAGPDCSLVHTAALNRARLSLRR